MATPKTCKFQPYRADLCFDRLSGQLLCDSIQATWYARSGAANLPRIPRNLGFGVQGKPFVDPLPSGMYYTDKKLLSMARNPRYNRSVFRDRKRFYWFLPIVQFCPKPKRGDRGDFGIHPDGKPPGTKGCIGLTASNTKPIFDALSKLIQRKGRILIAVL